MILRGENGREFAASFRVVEDAISAEIGNRCLAAEIPATHSANPSGRKRPG